MDGEVSEQSVLELSSIIEGGAAYFIRDLSSDAEKSAYRLSGSSSQSCQSQNSACSSRERTRGYRTPDLGA